MVPCRSQSERGTAFFSTPRSTNKPSLLHRATPSCVKNSCDEQVSCAHAHMHTYMRAQRTARVTRTATRVTDLAQSLGIDALFADELDLKRGERVRLACTGDACQLGDGVVQEMRATYVQQWRHLARSEQLRQLQLIGELRTRTRARRSA
jgi:hypothetical protein